MFFEYQMIIWVPLIVLAIASGMVKLFGHILHRLWYLVSLTIGNYTM